MAEMIGIEGRSLDTGLDSLGMILSFNSLSNPPPACDTSVCVHACTAVKSAPSHTYYFRTPVSRSRKESDVSTRQTDFLSLKAVPPLPPSPRLP